VDLQCSNAMITGKGELRFRVELMVAKNAIVSSDNRR
jgi:hypothetical protein